MPIRLDPVEAALLQNTGLFEIKRRTTQKLYMAFESLRLRLKDTAEELHLVLPEEVAAISAKISRGEQYQGCPWVMLDHHRYFQGEDMFAFRIMAWFGHYFSAHYILGGRYVSLMQGRLIPEKFGEVVFFCLHPDPWEHAPDEPGYRPLHLLTQEDMQAHITATCFLKLSIKIPTTDLQDMEDRVTAFYTACIASGK